MSSMHYHSYQYQPSSDQSYPPSPSDSSYSSSSGDPLFVSNVLPSYNHASTSAEPYHPPPPYSSNEEFVSLQNKPRSRTTTRINVYPYARINAKKEEVKRRRIWNHALEKSLFSPYELSTIGAPQRRSIYTASLEAHIDRLHNQLLEIGFWPVAFEALDVHKGLNSRTAKSKVAALQHDASIAKLKLLELERANEGLKNALGTPEAQDDDEVNLAMEGMHYNYLDYMY